MKLSIKDCLKIAKTFQDAAKILLFQEWLLFEYLLYTIKYSSIFKGCGVRKTGKYFLLQVRGY